MIKISILSPAIETVFDSWRLKFKTKDFKIALSLFAFMYLLICTAFMFGEKYRDLGIEDFFLSPPFDWLMVNILFFAVQPLIFFLASLYSFNISKKCSLVFSDTYFKIESSDHNITREYLDKPINYSDIAKFYSNGVNGLTVFLTSKKYPKI